MTITNQTNQVIYTGNGVATNFPFAFPVYDEDHLIVTKITIQDDTEEVISSANYSVSGIGDAAGGSVTYSPAISSSYQLRIERIVPYTQETDIHNQGAFLPEVIEEQLDLIVMQIQQIKQAVVDVDVDLDDEIELLQAQIEALLLTLGTADPVIKHFATRSAAMLVNISGAVTEVTTGGYSVAGDLGGARHKKVVSEPAHEGKFQSADGAWWEIAEAVVTPQMFGAKGDGVTDDATALNNMAVFARGDEDSAIKIFGPKGTYIAASQLDFTRVRHIDFIGEIHSSITTSGQAAVTIGTNTTAHTDMQDGDIHMTVRSTLANNTTLSGVVGIRLKGSARCKFRLYSYTFDIGVELAPDGATGVQYVAWNLFEHIYTNGCRTGLKFNGNYVSDLGWINENTFVKCDCYPQNNQLAGDTYGVHMTGSYGYNNNIFQSGAFEGQDYPIFIDYGLFNQFKNIRVESAGPVKFGRGASTNYIDVSYPNGLDGATQEWGAERPNVLSWLGQIWIPELLVTYDDFFAVGSVIHSRKLKNSVSANMQFSAGTLDAGARTFDVGSTHRGYHLLRVTKGDVFRVSGEFAAGTYYVSLLARDASDVALATLSSGDIPYIGTNATPAASGTTGTAAHIDILQTHALPFLFSVNRDEVFFVRIQIIPGSPMKTLLVERLVNGGRSFDGQLNKGMDTGLRLMEAYTAANIADATHAVNTTNKEVGKFVRDTTNNRIMVARGTTTTSIWDVVDGSVAVTPA